jgi:hypothetical protein
MPPTANQVHVDSALSNVSVAYKNPAYIFEDEIFPLVPTDKQSDMFFRFSKQHFREYDDSKRPGVDVNEIPIDLDSRGFFYCDGHALDYPNPDEIAANADPGADLDIEMTEKVTEGIRLKEEINGASKISVANLPLNTTLSGTSQWSDFVNSDPIPAVDDAKNLVEQATGLMPNRLMLPRVVFLKIRNHPKIIDRVKYTGTGMRQALTPENLAEAFEVEKVVIGGALKQSVPEGRADALTRVWGKNVLLYYKPPRPGKRVAALGYTFAWMVTVGANGRMRGDLADNTGGFIVRRYRYERRRSDIIGVEFYYDQHFIEPNAGYLFMNAIA